MVFTPDIYYSIGEPGESAYNSVVASAKQLSFIPEVNSFRIGINGHSFGGYETNYLVTHTDIFAAAATASGPTDLISQYLGFYGGEIYGTTKSSMVFGKQQMRMGVTLWENPDLYIKNSPVFDIDKVVTPLLIMHNKKDPLVDWYQGAEFFNGLRRLNKKSWMLQYDDGAHGLGGTESGKVDYTIRLTQFFDHYLKGYPPPKWMIEGRPAKLKGIDDRFELDLVGSCGDSCKICKEKKYDMNDALDVMNPNKKREKQTANKEAVTGR